MKKTIALAATAATMLWTAPGAFAQAAMAPAPGGTTMKSTATDAADTKASADAAAKPKAHHRMAKNTAALNASEAETTKQLNQEQAQLASSRGGGMSSGNPAP